MPHPSSCVCVGPPYGDPHPRCWHNAVVSLDLLAGWQWPDILAHLKCTKCGSIGWVDPPPNLGEVNKLFERHLLSESWSREFDEPIETPDGKQLRTLREAVAYLAKTVPKAERDMPAVTPSATRLR